VRPEPSRSELTNQENLLVEAVSLLVQRQRETESWVAQQVWQAEDRAASTERRYAELESRLVGIEDQLNRLVEDVTTPSAGPGEVADEGLARLRAQIEGLKSGGVGGASAASSATTHDADGVVPPAPSAVNSVVHEAHLQPSTAVVRETISPRTTYATVVTDVPRQAQTQSQSAGLPPVQPAAQAQQVQPPAPIAGAPAVRPAQSPGLLDLLGATPQDRMGVVLIGLGAIAVLYAILGQLHLG